MKKSKISKKVSPATLGEKIIKTLKNYLVSQLILMVFIILAVWGILSLLTVKYALILAVLAGTLSIIPNYGMIFASIVIVLVAIFDNVKFLPNAPAFVEGLVVLLILVLLNKLADLLLAPILLGKIGKINPIILIMVVFGGTILFGIPGAILATPVFLVIKTIWEHFKN